MSILYIWKIIALIMFNKTPWIYFSRPNLLLINIKLLCYFIFSSKPPKLILAHYSKQSNSSSYINITADPNHTHLSTSFRLQSFETLPLLLYPTGNKKMQK